MLCTPLWQKLSKCNLLFKYINSLSNVESGVYFLFTTTKLTFLMEISFGLVFEDERVRMFKTVVDIYVYQAHWDNLRLLLKFILIHVILVQMYNFL